MPFPILAAVVRLFGRMFLKDLLISEPEDAVEVVRRAAEKFLRSARVEVDTKPLGPLFGKFEKQLNFAAALTLTKAAQEIRQEAIREINIRFEKPTRFTTGAVRYERATVASQESKVFIRRDGRYGPGELLRQHFAGGTRIAKRYEAQLRAAGFLKPGEVTVPGAGARIDANGNIARSELTAILKSLAGASSRARVTTKRKVRKQAGVIFWADGHRGMAKGAWRRTAATVRPLLLVTSQQPRYQVRIDLEAIAQRVLRNRLQSIWRDSLRQAMATAR